MDNRESFKSRLGFLLVSAGCAIGIGNVWKFPWLVGQYGGGIFVLIYLVFLVIMGIPVLTMEIGIGRASRQSTVNGFKALERKGQKWHLEGYFSIAGCYLLLMYYHSVTGWMLNYGWKFIAGQFTEGTDVSEVFSSMLSSIPQSLIFMLLAVAIGIIVCAKGLQNGVEKVSKFMMLGLLALIVILVIHSFTLSGAGEGLYFYLVPSMDAIKEHGLGNIIVAAMNQAFFTLSLGICAMEIFGTYMNKEHTLLSEGARICALDTFVAFCSGLIIFPACFSYGIEPGNGPSLIFMTLPQVFMNMKGGRIWGTLFFVFMSFAALSTVLAVMENIIASFMDTFGWSRKKSIIVNAIGLTVLSLPVAFEYNLFSGIASKMTSLWGKGLLDSEDFLVSNLLLPIGSLVMCLFCTWKSGWGYDNFIEEANTGVGLKYSSEEMVVKYAVTDLQGNTVNYCKKHNRLKKVLRFYLSYILPLIIIAIIIVGLV